MSSPFKLEQVEKVESMAKTGLMSPSEIVSIVIVMAALAAWSLYGFLGTETKNVHAGSTVMKESPFQTERDSDKNLRSEKLANITKVTPTTKPPQTAAPVVIDNDVHATTNVPRGNELFVVDPTIENIVTYDNENKGMETKFAQDFFNGRICRTLQGDYSETNYTQHHHLVNVSFSCYELYKNSGLGTGNFISAFYGLRMAAHALNRTDVWLQCSDAEERKKELLLPWMMGMFPQMTEEEQATEELPTLKTACSNYKSIPIGYRWKDMRYEWRRMAIAMVGIPSPDHPAAAWAEENLWKESTPHRHGKDTMQIATPQRDDTPLFPGTELDDALLHFRCGDIIASNHPSFGFMKFGSFSRHLSPDVRTIGIATQPFDMNAQMRKAEGGPWKQERCKKVVYAFVDHLKEEFPEARIRIHNGLNETIALTFARMIMANQTVIGITSFGVFPGVTTFGTGYIRKPDYIKAPNRWLLTSPLVDRVDNIKLIEEPRLMAGQCKGMWPTDEGETVLAWFRNYTAR